MSAVTDATLAKFETPGFLDRLWRRPGAFFALVFLAVLYGSLPFVELIAPYGTETRSNDALFAPPADVNWFHMGIHRTVRYGMTSSVDLKRFADLFDRHEKVERFGSCVRAIRIGFGI
jgi:peptide/nickel transport system permease protein